MSFNFNLVLCFRELLIIDTEGRTADSSIDIRIGLIGASSIERMRYWIAFQYVKI
jgi:hypothetical protein